MPIDVQADELNLVFRKNVRARRKALGLTQDEIAERMNGKRKRRGPQVSAPYISDLESGKRVPYISTLAELAEALETTPDALLSAEPALA